MRRHESCFTGMCTFYVEKQMSEDLKKFSRRDGVRIDVGDKWELRYWSEAFGCTPWELKAAVNVVGTSAGNVAAHLGKARVRQAACGVRC